MAAKQKYEWMTYPEAAIYLGATERQVRRWVGQGRVPCTKLGLRTLFDAARLDEFVRDNSVGGAA